MINSESMWMPLQYFALVLVIIAWAFRELTLKNTIDKLRTTNNNLIDLDLKKTNEVSVLKSELGILRDVIDTPHNPIFVFDSELRIIFANTATQELFQVPQNDLLNMKLDELINDPIQVNSLRYIADRALSLAITNQVSELKIRDKHDDKSTYSLTVKPLNGDGSGVVIVATDITTTLHVMQLNYALQEKYTNLVENSRNLIIQIDGNQKITYCNPACNAILGFSQKELLNKEILEFIHQDDQRKFKAQWGRWSFMTRRKEEPKWEFRFVDSSNSIKVMLLSVTFYWVEDVFVGVQMDAVDITDLKSATAEATSLNKKYRELVQTYEDALKTIVSRDVNP